MATVLKAVGPDGVHPHPLENVEAEAALIGACMIANEIIPAVGKRVAPDDFSLGVHGRIFSAIVERHEQGKSVTPLFLRPMAESDEELKRLGGQKYLAGLTGDASGLLAPDTLADEIRDFAKRRRLRDGLREALNAVGDLATPTADIAALASEAVSGDDLAHKKSALRAVDAFDFDEADIPARPWLVPGALLAGYTHILAAPGGSGKSLFTLQLAIALARGKPWGSFVPRRKCRSLIINVEDDIDEQRRRLAAARRVMDAGDELRGMIDLVPNAESIVAAGRTPDGLSLRTTPIVETLANYIEERNIDVLIVDPFAETFDGDENDNSEVKWAMKIWRDEIARRTGCAVYLVHHTVKYAGHGAGDANVIRGAGAIVNSTRISATLMPMTAEDADMVGIDQAERHLYVRYDDAKANQSLKTNTARWFEKTTVEIGNGSNEGAGDEVGALVPWTPPDAFDGLTGHTIKVILDRVEQGMESGERYTMSARGGSKESGRWIGCLIMGEAGLTEPFAKKVAQTWKANGVLIEDEYHCPVARRKRKGLFAPENSRPGVSI